MQKLECGDNENQIYGGIMNITKDDIQKVINQLESSVDSSERMFYEGPFYEACQMLKELIEEKPWEPKEYDPYWWINVSGEVCPPECISPKAIMGYGNRWPTKELAKTARDMNKRNQLILQAKTEIGAKDGRLYITKGRSGLWQASSSDWIPDPEITFESQYQAEQVIKMLRLNEGD